MYGCKLQKYKNKRPEKSQKTKTKKEFQKMTGDRLQAVDLPAPPPTRAGLLLPRALSFCLPTSD
jgi:hypothetical protein